MEINKKVDNSKYSNDRIEKQSGSPYDKTTPHHRNRDPYTGRKASMESGSSSSDLNDDGKYRRRDSSSASDSFHEKKNQRTSSLDRPIRNKRYIVEPLPCSPNRNYERTRKYSPREPKNYKPPFTTNERSQSKIITPGFDIPLVTLAVFNELQQDVFPIDMIEHSYREYKEKYEQKKFKSFFVEHQNEEWFKEKYDSEYIAKLAQEKSLQCQKSAAKYIENLISGKFKNLSLELNEQEQINKNVKVLLYTYNKESLSFEEIERNTQAVTEETNDKSNLLYYGFDPDRLTLFIHHIPVNVSRLQILDVIKKSPGFLSMSFSEPLRNQNYSRYCWFTFDTEENCDLAYESLKDYKITPEFRINPIKSKSSTIKKVRITPPYYDERIQEDLEYSKSLIVMYDKVRGVETNELFDLKETRSKECQLDLQILYLRRVHGFCYYCIEEHEDERMIATKCDNIHLRNQIRLGPRKSLDDSNEFHWDRYFTKQVNDFIQKGITNKITVATNEELNRRRQEYYKQNTTTVSAERFMCNICQKMFKGPNFVYNHIFNKHLNLVQENVDNEFNEKRKFENYVSDPNKIYDKYKIITSMEEYLSYLNSVKKSNDHYHQHNRRPNYSREQRDTRDRDSNYKHKRQREFKDYDDPEQLQSASITSSRNLISYDDL